MPETLDFEVGQVINVSQAGKTIQERFEKFHELNPWVYNALERLTGDLVSRGRKRIGMKMLCEVLRWQTSRITVGDEPFKLSNDFTSRYARLIMDNHPEWDGIFQTKTLRTP